MNLSERQNCQRYLEFGNLSLAVERQVGVHGLVVDRQTLVPVTELLEVAHQIADSKSISETFGRVRGSDSAVCSANFAEKEGRKEDRGGTDCSAARLDSRDPSTIAMMEKTRWASFEIISRICQLGSEVTPLWTSSEKNESRFTTTPFPITFMH